MYFFIVDFSNRWRKTCCTTPGKPSSDLHKSRNEVIIIYNYVCTLPNREQTKLAPRICSKTMQCKIPRLKLFHIYSLSTKIITVNGPNCLDVRHWLSDLWGTDTDQAVMPVKTLVHTAPFLICSQYVMAYGLVDHKLVMATMEPPPHMTLDVDWCHKCNSEGAYKP